MLQLADSGSTGSGLESWANVRLMSLMYSVRPCVIWQTHLLDGPETEQNAEAAQAAGDEQRAARQPLRRRCASASGGARGCCWS